MSKKNTALYQPSSTVGRLSDLRSGAEVIKLFPCSTQRSMKFEMLINIEIVKIDGIYRFK